MHNLPELLCHRFPDLRRASGGIVHRNRGWMREEGAKALEWAMLESWQHRSIVVDAEMPAPLVMLPGTLCDARLYGPVLDALGVRASIPALSGAGSAVAFAQYLLAQLPDRFSLCGFSLGAIIALEIAAQAPDRVERLALIGCNPGMLDGDAARIRAALSRDEFVASSFDHADPVIHALIDEMAADTSAEDYAQQTRITLTRHDSRPRLAALTMPVLILCGCEDRICPAALSIEMAASVPHSRLALIDGAGHYVTLEQPQAVAAELSAWLATPAPTLH
jgi:pimeloyl-ACP methyl ester carboxylesterase